MLLLKLIISSFWALIITILRQLLTIHVMNEYSLISIEIDAYQGKLLSSESFPSIGALPAWKPEKPLGIEGVYRHFSPQGVVGMKTQWMWVFL